MKRVVYNRSYQRVRELLSIKSLLYFLVGLSFIVQLILILYNHISGYHTLDSLLYFVFRLSKGIIISTLFGLLIAYPNLLMISFLNKKRKWSSNMIQRVLTQLLFVVTISVIVSIGFTLFNHQFWPYREDLNGVLVNNALIFIIVNIIATSILEAWIYYNQSTKSEEIARKLTQELSQIKFEVLKNQLNPHFLFNSLNVLSGLIMEDTIKAQKFIDDFSHIYRYVLQTIEQPVVTLEEEINFMRSYLFLQQIRYGDNLTFSLEIESSKLSHLLPPLSLQVILENAIKHNTIDEKSPLEINLFCKKNALIVKNNIQPKISKITSNRVGIENLKKRYQLISSKTPTFYMDTNYYIAELPLITPDSDESIDN